MPTHSLAELDPVTSLVSFRTSSVFEMLSSLQGVADARRMPELTRDAAAVMGVDFVERLRELYERFHSGCDFSEFPVDYPDHHDIDGFLRYIRDMDVRKFTFYVLGRRFPLESIPAPPTKDSIRELLSRSADSELLYQIYPYLDWAEDVPALKTQLVSMWSAYWTGFFSSKVSGLNEAWETSIREKEDLLRQRGGTHLYEQVTGHSKLPPPLPPDRPVEHVEFFPMYHTSRSSCVYYGYGTVTVLYDLSRNDEKIREIESDRVNALGTLRALADENRLKILKLVNCNQKAMNGKKLAEIMKLSPSVVSRHLSQLKDAGLIEIHSPDNRNITYSLRHQRLQEMLHEIENYLDD